MAEPNQRVYVAIGGPYDGRRIILNEPPVGATGVSSIYQLPFVTEADDLRSITYHDYALESIFEAKFLLSQEIEEFESLDKVIELLLGAYVESIDYRGQMHAEFSRPTASTPRSR